MRKIVCSTSRGALVSASIAALVLALGAMPAAAQDDPQPADQASEPTPGQEAEIVVTAQFREQRLQDTPIAITAVNAEMLQARSQTNIAEVAAQAPNVTLKPQGPAFGPSLAASIRGVGQYDFNPALEPGVGLYVDDVYYATLTGAIFDLLDLERVEILRGPQGTLAGKNSIGGAVKLFSKRPTGDGSGYVYGAYGSRNRIDLRAGADFKLTDDLFMRVAGVARKQGGYVDRLDFGCVNPPGSTLNPAVGGVASLTGGDCRITRDGDVNYQAGRVQLRYTPSDRIDVNIIADYTNDDRNAAASVLLLANNTANPNIRGNATAVPYDSRFICGQYCNYASYFSPAGSWQTPPVAGFPLIETRGDGRSKFNGWGVSGQIDFDINDDLQLQSITAYRQYDLDFTNDDDNSPLAISNGFGNLDYWGFTQELRLNGSMLDDALNWTLGAFYLDQRSTYATFQDIRYAPIPLQFQGDDPVNASTKAAFAALSWEIIDALTLNLGARYTDEHKDYTFSRRNRDGSLNPFLGALDGVTGVYDGSKFDWRVNLQYRLSDEVMTYAQVSTGFKGGGIGPRPFNPAQVQPFGPETLTAYEVGIKTDLFDRVVRLNAAAFFSDYTDIQLTLLACPQFGGPGPCALPQNAGDAHIKGLELETTIDPGNGLLVDGSLSYLDFDYTSINPQAGGPSAPGGVQEGMIAPYTPKWKWALGVQYEIDLGTTGSITPRVDASYQSDIFSNAVNGPNNHIDGYTLANARLTWRNPDEDLEVSLEVTNLFDKYYLLTSFDLTGAGAGLVSGQPGRPREWAVSVKKTF
ncbi:TonB-dependent receptor [Altererythrobacter sp. Root672]|uniref:TonB-dependent receptor n=1 Tax=Altererythrobacter sp. Root672 TaxID=1736584 RepID=UPI0009E8CC1E|nr:TonB-dependent receptor [Altererythrobacter sp. Root672]